MYSVYVYLSSKHLYTNHIMLKWEDWYGLLWGGDLACLWPPGVRNEFCFASHYALLMATQMTNTNASSMMCSIPQSQDYIQLNQCHAMPPAAIGAG